jgi:hypothetical protein
MLLDGPDPRIFSCAAAGDVAGLRKLFQEVPACLPACLAACLLDGKQACTLL